MKIFDDRKIEIDLPKLIDSRALLCANSGGGKSYTIRKLLEEVGAGVMSIVLDVEGEFKTLREKYDYLLIGQGGDVSISLKAAHLLPAKLMQLRVSTIIDISDLKIKDRIAYVKKFLEALMELPRKYWRPCLVIVDEAHMYCGQQEKQDSTHAVIDLMTRGRKRGYCGILATQRIAKLHKDAAAEANNYMVGRTGLDIDMKRAAEILGFASKADMLSMRNLEAGEFYVFGPAISRYVKKAKVARVKTTHPKVGMDLRGKITPPTQKIKAMLSKLNDLPKEAEEKIKTLEELRKQIRELKRQQKSEPTRASQRQLEQAEARGYARFQKEYMLKERERVGLRTRLKKIGELADVSGMPPIVQQMKACSKAVVEKPRKMVPPGPIESKSEIDDNTKLNRCERSILSLLYNNPHRQFKKTNAALFTGYSHKSGGFNNAICHLNSLGLIRRNSGLLGLAEDHEVEIEQLLGGDINLHEEFTIENWAKKLPKCESKIFSYLLSNPDEDFSKEEIGEATNYAFDSGGFNNAICRLNSLGLIIRSSGRMKLNSEILEG